MMSTGSAPTLYLNYERDRLQTFDSWTNMGVNKHELAKYGFYSKGPGDAVECAYCKVVIARWDYGDNPLREHIKWSPSCPFLLHQMPVNVAINENFENELPSPKYFTPIIYNDDDSINQAYNRPTEKIVLTGVAAIHHPVYQSQEERLKSFRTWPRALKQSPQDLSEAGLFYLRVGDQVKCFSCGGALRNWNDKDVPWVEHAKCYPNCDYLIKCKGEQFINDVKASNDDDDDDDVTINGSTNDEDVDIHDERTTMNKCKICLAKDLNAIFRPCMHIYTCGRCGYEFTQCPVCRTKIAYYDKCHIVNGGILTFKFLGNIDKQLVKYHNT